MIFCPSDLYSAKHAIQSRDELKPLLRSISLQSHEFQKTFLLILDEIPELEPCQLLRIALQTYNSSSQYQQQQPSVETIEGLSPKITKQLLSTNVEVPLSQALSEGIRERKFLLYQISIPSDVGKTHIGLTDLDLDSAVEHHITRANQGAKESLYDELRRFSFLYTSRVLEEFPNEVHARLALSQIESELNGSEIVLLREYKVNHSEQDRSFTVQDLIAEEIHLRQLRKTNQRELRKTVDFTKRASARLDQIYLKKLASIPLVESESKKLDEVMAKTFGIHLADAPSCIDPIPVFDADSTKRRQPNAGELKFKDNQSDSLKKLGSYISSPKPIENGKYELSLFWCRSVDKAKATAKERAQQLKSVYLEYLALANQFAKDVEIEARNSSEATYIEAEKQFKEGKELLLAREYLVEYRFSKKTSQVSLRFKPDSGRLVDINSEQICFVTDSENIRVSPEWTSGKPEETLFGMKWPLCFRFDDIEAVFVKYGTNTFNDVNQASAYVKELVKSGNIDCGPGIRFVLGVRSGFLGSQSYKVFNADGQQIKSLTGYYK